MKHLKKYKLFESTKSIDDICKKYDIKNYTINPDGTVDVDDNIDLIDFNLTKIPIEFGHVTGDFLCDNNQLTTLEGCPKSVGGNFRCDNNQLTSLKGCPESVGDKFRCDNNQLTTLEGCPKSVGGNLFCDNNQLTTLKGGPTQVGGNFYCYNNQLTSLEGCPESIGGDLYCYNNQLTTLYGLSDIIIMGRFFYIDDVPIPILHSLIDGWLENGDKPDMDRIELFNDVGVVNVIGDTVYLAKLEYFHEFIGVPMPDINKIKKYYKIIE